MARDVFEVLDAGMQATVQDLGRPGHQSIGMPVAGAFDPFALRAANLLLGNGMGDRYLVGSDPGDAGIEVLLFGLRLRALRTTFIAVTGADLRASLDGQPIPPWQTVEMRQEQVLAFAGPGSGARAYLAVEGGVDVPPFLGSRSTFVRGKVGGYLGRPLQAGDTIAAGPEHPRRDRLAGRRLRPDLIPIGSPRELRVMMGPQDDLFSDEAVDLFLRTEWQVSPRSDRMGVRLIGPPLPLKPRSRDLAYQAGADPSNIVDDPIPIGGVQVAGGVEPIVLGVEGPSTGGYAKIATVVQADLGRLGQLVPGDTVRFRPIDHQDAAAAAADLETLLSDANVIRVR